MKRLDKIPTSKIERATKLVTTGLKVGVNYITNFNLSNKYFLNDGLDPGDLNQRKDLTAEMKTIRDKYVSQFGKKNAFQPVTKAAPTKPTK